MASQLTIALCLLCLAPVDAVVIVTGANGRTGMEVYRAIKEEGKLEVRALVRKWTDDLPKILGCHKCDESEGIFIGDVTDRRSLNKAFDGVDIVYSAVGVSGNGPVTDEDLIKKVELDGVKNQVAALKNGKRRSLYSSILMLFGRGTSTPTQPEKRFFLLSTIGTASPRNLVQKYKRQAEDFIMNDSGLPFIILEPCGLAEDFGNQRELLVGHDGNGRTDWYPKGFYMIPRKDVASVSAAALAAPPSDKVRFNLCAKLPGSAPAPMASVLAEAGKMPWQRPSDWMSETVAV